MKTKVGVVMCPAWSLETPPLSLGLLAGALKTKGYAYVGDNPVGSSGPKKTKVKLTEVKNK